MFRMSRNKKTRIISVLILVTTSVYFICQSMTIRSDSVVIGKIRDSTVRASKKNGAGGYFYGPARVPNIPEEHFPKPMFDKKYFIYDCSSGVCGGLGDRQEGIVAAYLISQMMGRRFGVQITIPCDVRNILMENKDSWIVNETSLWGLTTQRYKVLDHSAWTVRSNIHNMNFEQQFTSDVIFFNVNQEFVQYIMKVPRFSTLKWAQNRTAADIYNIVLRRLFRLKPLYQERFEKFQKLVREEGRQLVCAHIRLHSHRHSDYHMDPKASEYVNIIWSMLRKYNNPKLYRMFVATNADFVRQEAKELFPGMVVDVDGPIIHVDEDRQGPTCEGMAKTHIDQMILSTCDVFIMSDSGFGRVGAMMRGTDENLYNLAGKASYADKDFMPPYW